MEQHRSALTIDIRRLRVLRELRGQGTIAATAEALHLTPSAISQQITALSRELGVPLLVPQGRRVRLTPQAMLLLDHAAAIDAELERARADLAAYDQDVIGPVAIGAFATAITGIVAPALPGLRRNHPRLHVSVLEVEAPDCFTRLDAGDLDVVVTIDYLNGPRRDNPRYSRSELTADPLRAVLPADHPLAGQSAIDLRDLADSSWIVGAIRGPCQEVGLSACQAAGFRPDIRHHANDWAAAIALVAAGCGVALVPDMALSGNALGGVVVRPLQEPHRPSRPIYAAVRAGSETHPGLVAVLDALRQEARRADTEKAAQ